MLTDPTRRDADVKCINRNRAGERERLSRIDITKLLPGSIIKEGNRYLLDRLFFIIYNFRLSAPFYPLISWCSRDFGYLNTLFSKSLDIPFLNCLILPERSLHHGITSVLFSALFILLHSIVRQIFVWAVPSPTLFDSTISSPSILTLCSFASLISPLSPVHSYGGWGPPPIHSYRVTGNEWHNHQWLLLWSRYIAGGGHNVTNTFNAIA